MKTHEKGFYRSIASILLCAGLTWGNFAALATDNSALVSMTIASNTVFMPRAMFTQTWTVKNTGTTTWAATANGYTMNMVSNDCLGAIPLAPNDGVYPPSAHLNAGVSVAPGGQGSYSIMFIAPEMAGSYTDTFQMNTTGGAYFGPKYTVQITVARAGSTNQYDRARAVSYANNYADYVVSDGYFWTSGSDYPYYGTNFVPTPTNLVGDDCAHFVSCCIGRQSNDWGGGIYVASRVPPTYGEPGAPEIVNTILIAHGYAEEVSSISQMEPGDVIGWNWEGDTNIADLDHVTLYLGNDMTASHAVSALEVSAETFFQDGEPDFVRHLVHIFDAPSLHVAKSGTSLKLSWTTNWSGYALYSSPSLATNATWAKVTTTPIKSGISNILTTTMPSQALFYRLMMP